METVKLCKNPQTPIYLPVDAAFFIDRYKMFHTKNAHNLLLGKNMSTFRRGSRKKKKRKGSAITTRKKAVEVY